MVGKGQSHPMISCVSWSSAQPLLLAHLQPAQAV